MVEIGAIQLLGRYRQFWCIAFSPMTRKMQWCQTMFVVSLWHETSLWHLNKKLVLLQRFGISRMTTSQLHSRLCNGGSGHAGVNLMHMPCLTKFASVFCSYCKLNSAIIVDFSDSMWSRKSRGTMFTLWCKSNHDLISDCILIWKMRLVFSRIIMFDRFQLLLFKYCQSA